MEFQVGDKVLLKVSPWKGVIRFGKQGKLNPRYIGPFKILIRIGPMAYQLNLSAELDGVHNVFHVSNLKKYLSDETLVIPLDEIQVDERLRFVGEPVEIMDREVKRLKQSRILIARFRCNSKRGPEFTREREDQMMRKYPHLSKQTTISVRNRARAKSNRRNRKTRNGTRRGTRQPHRQKAPRYAMKTGSRDSRISSRYATKTFDRPSRLWRSRRVSRTVKKFETTIKPVACHHQKLFELESVALRKLRHAHKDRMLGWSPMHQL
ncbi:hypothetical protein E3N88_22577 [Mikania micrantha]|uniref:Tf2-1-like SH3-like domain-containing protein n=1 Tax=Mikania micrantha TaxID=192012 RepID=A0A5N6NAS6_9ASTR|nr:hypothetical protein E3N88_22577 [Mikania micrantha]